MSFFLFIFLLGARHGPRLRADQFMRFAWLLPHPLHAGERAVLGALLLLPLDAIRIAIAAVVESLLLISVVWPARRPPGVKAARPPARWLHTQRRTPRPAPLPSISPERAPAGARAGNWLRVSTIKAARKLR